MIELTKPQSELFLHPAPLNLFLAGKGSGKSHYAGIIASILISKYPTVKGFIGANTFDQLNTSTMTKILEVWRGMGITEWNEKDKIGHFVIHKQPPVLFKDVGHNYISYKNIVTFINGATIYLGSLDNAKAHEGKEFGWALLDETKDSKEEDVKDTILSRLRQKGIYVDENGSYSDKGKDINPLYIFTSPAKVQWINEWFELDGERSSIESVIFSEETFYKKHTERFNIVISSTHHNQKNLPSDYIANLKASNTEDKVKMIIYGSPFARSGTEYITAFNEINYIRNASYDNTKALHFSFDFNISPYNSCGVYQLEKIILGYDETRFKTELNHIISKLIGKYGYCYLVQGISEIALKPPQNSVGKMCDEILKIYGNHTAGIFIYGDATGRNRNIAYEEYKHHYDQIEHKLYRLMSTQSMRVLRSNPPNVKRRDGINVIFEAKMPIVICLDKCMKYTLEDIMYCKVDADGAKDSEVTKDKETMETYEKRGHFLDLLEYMLFSAFKQYLN